jgi:triosephosphate isomerase
MNTTKDEAHALASEAIALAKGERPADVAMVFGVPFVHLQMVSELVRDEEGIFLAAQNCSQHASGAYTGEVSAAMIASYGASYVILGHSERRQYFGEKDEELKAKTAQALENGLKVIYCCGETLDQRNAGKQVEVVLGQLKNELFQLSAEEMAEVVIAYEPVWAIGTGVTATTDQAQEMHAEIRKMLTDKYGSDVANSTSILYGGSAKPTNATELFACEDVDGGLIGGASLKARSFMDIALSYPQ